MITHAKRDRARELRGNATPFEQIFWQTVRGHRFAGFKFRRQQVIGPFIVDFACPLRQNSCRLIRISTMGGDKGWKWQGTQRSSKVER